MPSETPDQAPEETPDEYDGANGVDLDTAVVRALNRLTDGRPVAFADRSEPPAGVAAYLKQADARQIRGVLVLAIYRWCELGS